VALAPSGPPVAARREPNTAATSQREAAHPGNAPVPSPRAPARAQSTVYLEIFIKSDGAISAVSIAGSSSHPLLDEAALEAVRSLAPAFPKGLAPRPLRVRLPVVFDLQ